ncbi:MAG: 2-oxoacid:acceptor oxidoreductase subunit alpha, partial [Terriglobales bacterium]
KPIDRGKVLNAADLERLGGFSRYKDVDGDAIPYRTLPGTPHKAAAYFTRGSGHNERAQYSERADDYTNNMDRLSRKFDTARKFVPAPVKEVSGTSKTGIIAYGTSHWAVAEALDQLVKEHGIKADYLRLRAFPFNQDVHEFIRAHDVVYVVEQNRDGQMHELLKLDAAPEQVTKLRRVLHYNGLPMDARSVSDEIVRQEAK